jgi:hypothetical protein
MQYDTGRGVFRPGGRGGGIFDGNISGYAGLGAVPAQCWDVPGFKECHDQQFVKAQLYCNSQSEQWLKDRGYADVDSCIKQTDSAFTQENCVSKYCPPGGTTAKAPVSGSYPWGVYSADTLALQKQTNKALKEAGLCPTGEDGKLGKSTCGAIKKLLGQAAAPGTCQSFADPKKPPCASGAPAPTSTPSALTPEQQAALVAQYGKGGGSDWTKYLLFAGGAAVVLGLAYYLDSRRKK